MQYVLITGSNRGIGLALAKACVAQGDKVFATCRQPDTADALQTLAQENPDQVTIIPLSVTDESSLNSCVDAVMSVTDTLDILINNAGIFPKAPEHTQLGALEADALNSVLQVNSVAPVMITQALLPLLKNSANPRVVMVSSHMGSIERAGTSGLSYRMSKAAVNMATKVLSGMLHDDNVTVITTHPGHVATDMGGSTAPVSPDDSAAGLLSIANDVTIADTGKFLNYTGESLPW
ncbi:MAG: SDR family oxidoreductase [Chloroflexota bacterium]